ncbi:hypothetical protein Back11_07890 [Paenibacillus baekrokdamisoli]|uniref:Uncharacterized protein n=1 Tax=Paenibacillus baekrokdamisoli TaxID=1712516 RepID=A0A3G9J843_9BACL|nr:hypothetical protein [Paenibacillus baekrokdamisoli]MBB3067370.1 hypothetical protein [Paenibacillus baekrokdamisoli]BBH19444.1 hypothetical protein Back11_07890 [Paenibacillus baekrokdamisoli]
MKKIGFIDYFLDEWHAEKYPGWIEEASGGQCKVIYAYGKIDSPSGVSNAEWCAKKDIELLSSIEEVVEKSDYLIVLSPDHPEFHEELSQLPLRSGKPTYIDKTFAPDRKTALALFDLARLHGTSIYSSSALRFATEYIEADRQGIETIASIGPGRFENYSIHQIEPVVSLLGNDPRRLMWIGTENSPALLIQFAGGKLAEIRQFGWECPFGMAVNYESGSTKLIKAESDFFTAFIKGMLAFFESGKPAVEESETIAIITIIEYGMKAAQIPYQWVELPE